MGKPKSPKAPDPVETGKAQTGTNVATAIANQLGNMTNQVTPYGSKNYSQSGDFTFTDPVSGTSYSIPRFTETTTLTKDGQYLQDKTVQTQKNLADMSVNQSDRLGQLLSKPLNLNGLPARTDAPQMAQIGGGPKLASTFGGTGPITMSYGTDWSQDRQKVEDAIMSRLAPQQAQDRATMEAQLAQQGIVKGSQAYDREMSRMDQSVTDSRMQAILAGGQEQSRLAGLAQDQARFQNSAQQQDYDQNLGRATFGNAALQQMHQNSAAADSANNTTAMQRWQATQAQRADALNEKVQLRQQPINEIMAMQSGSQVQAPTFGSTPGFNMGTTDYAGLYRQDFANRNALYNQKLQSWNDLWGGLMGAGRNIFAGAFA